MTNPLTLSLPCAVFTPRLVPITGDRLIHPADARNDLARIVLRWGRGWLPETWSARQFFSSLGKGDDEAPCYRDEAVSGWLLLPPREGSLAWKVRSGEIDVGTALAAEAEAWPHHGDHVRASHTFE